MPTKILVGTDGSATAAKAVDRAVEVANAAHAPLTILSAGPRDLAARVVDAEAARHAGSGVVIETEVATGEASSALVSVASSGGFDLLVVGNRGMTGISRILRLGSVPSRVMHRLPCSVLVVRTT